ncbi:MAG: NUDIX domain-containing protein [Ruminococcaceae bacterium]|nr:NUDIX domain-containing protein [Oscillospiraceae bacterium]
MVYEKSCGALVVRREGDQYFVLMIRHKAKGNRSFPKGHMEEGESEYITALREVMEETSSRIAIISDFRATVNYSPSPGVMKEVVYFLAFTTNPDIKPREGEIAEVEWIPLERAEECLAHENDKTVFRAAMERMQHMSVHIK